MTEEHKAFTTGVVVGIVLTALIIWLPLSFVLYVEAQGLREAAIKAGFARWEVVNLSTGFTEFKWIVPAEKK